MNRLIDLATQRRARALGNYWDTVSRRSPSVELRPPDGDPELVDLIRSLQRVADEDRSRPTGHDSLPRPLLLAHREMTVESESARPARPVPIERPRRLGEPPEIRGRWASIAVTAAVLIALVGTLSQASNRSGSVWGWLRDRNGPSGPAIDAPVATTIPADDGLLTITLPAGAIPRGEGVNAGLAHFSIPPGTRSTWIPYCCPGPMVEYVIAGTYTVRAESAVRVVRADGTEEVVAAGVETVLDPGDALISRNETVVEGANTGDVPVELLNWVLLAAGGFGGHALPGWASHNVDVQGELVLPPGSAEVRLTTIELHPGTPVPLPSDGSLTFVVTLPSNALGTPVPSAYRDGDGAITSGRQVATVYLLTVSWTGVGTPTPGTPIS